MKEKICVDKDAYVEGNSDVEVDFGKVGTDKNDDYDAYDPGTDSDGANSWHSLEMKTPPNSEDELEEETESDEVFPVFREGARFGELHLEVGMNFNTKWDFKEAVREYTIQEGRRIRFNKNDRKRLRTVCKVKECSWVIFASKDRDDTCWHCDANTFFKTKYDLSLNRNSISRTLSDARNLVYGDEKAQYAMVRDYGETLLKTNPGSTVKICTIPQSNGDVIFEKMYVCLTGCKNGFKVGCRPLIGLDGAFLKTVFGGQILSAIGQDTNHHIYVIAWAIVEVENTANWKWFLELLHADFRDYKTHGWCFISNMQKGLINAVQEVMPNVHHRFCEHRKKLKRLNPEAWAYLEKWPTHSWIRSQFSHKPKLDSICNNACEVFNAKIKEARRKPIITLLEEVKMFVMRTMAKNKVKLDNHVGILPPVIKSRLEKLRKESRQWQPN
ncbi:uncharacterized protein [Arachis hypogaea]|uniref:uncharacterized protein n=1 Tax=Arachis hypogaea TaxID=3818 RepID=UPI003B2123D9